MMIFPWYIFIPQANGNSPSSCGLISIVTFLFKGKNFLVLNSPNTTSSKHVEGSFRRKLSCIVCPFLTTIVLGLYPPSTRISTLSATSTCWSFFIRKNQYTNPIAQISIIVISSLSIAIVSRTCTFFRVPLGFFLKYLHNFTDCLFFFPLIHCIGNTCF